MVAVATSAVATGLGTLLFVGWWRRRRNSSAVGGVEPAVKL
jgi:hypothetical protein